MNKWKECFLETLAELQLFYKMKVKPFILNLYTRVCNVFSIFRSK